MEFIKCKKPGLLTTIQDLGRHDFQHFGIPVSGAMDPLSLRLANIIVGNPENEAVLEITLVGPVLEFEGEGLIAITGASLSPKINGKSVAMWRTIEVKDNDILSFGAATKGCYSYISIFGGIKVPEVMGSKSTYIRGNYGGIKGRNLKANDYIYIKSSQPKNSQKNKRLPNKYIPDIGSKRPIRFIWGPHDDHFTKEAKKTFVQSTFLVTNHSDRMGYRLHGEKLNHKTSADIISDYVAPGAIQVPSNGQPVVLMADCQMSGGYTKIGMVITVDLPFVAQKKFGDSISFKAFTIDEAQREWKIRERWLSRLSINNL